MVILSIRELARMYRPVKMIFALCCACLSLAACGGGGGGGGSSVAVVKTGTFIDGPVEGLTYESGGQKGVTDAAGTFHYEEGQLVTFSVGGVVLGQAAAKAEMTPIDLAPPGANGDTAEVVNRVKFLMALSVIDGAGRMTIPQVVRDKRLVQAVDFASVDDGALGALVQTLGSGKSLETKEAAINHLAASLGRDILPPTAPVLNTPSDIEVAHNYAKLYWSAATDATGVTGYAVYRGNVEVGRTSGGITALTDNYQFTPHSAYAYQVKAFDAAGNLSSGSNIVTVIVPGSPGTVEAAGDLAP